MAAPFFSRPKKKSRPQFRWISCFCHLKTHSLRHLAFACWCEPSQGFFLPFFCPSPFRRRSMSDSSSDEDAQLSLLLAARARPAAARACPPRAPTGPAASATTSSARSFMSMRAESSDSDAAEEEPPPRHCGYVQRLAAENADRRGSYDRTADGVQKRKPFAQYAYEHRQLIEKNQLGVPCLPTCPHKQKCWMYIPPATMMAAHERIYGTWAECDTEGVYTCASNQAAAGEQHVSLMQTWVTLTATDPPKVSDIQRIGLHMLVSMHASNQAAICVVLAWCQGPDQDSNIDSLCTGEPIVFCGR